LSFLLRGRKRTRVQRRREEGERMCLLPGKRERDEQGSVRTSIHLCRIKEKVPRSYRKKRRLLIQENGLFEFHAHKKERTNLKNWKRRGGRGGRRKPKD